MGPLRPVAGNAFMESNISVHGGPSFRRVVFPHARCSQKRATLFKYVQILGAQTTDANNNNKRWKVTLSQH